MLRVTGSLYSLVSSLSLDGGNISPFFFFLNFWKDGKNISKDITIFTIFFNLTKFFNEDTFHKNLIQLKSITFLSF